MSWRLSARQLVVWVLIGFVLVNTATVAAETFTGVYYPEPIGEGGNADAHAGAHVYFGDNWRWEGSQPGHDKGINISTRDNGWINVSATGDGPTITIDTINDTWTNTSSISGTGTHNVTLQPSNKNFSRVGGTIDEFRYRDPAVSDGQVDFEYEASSNGAVVVLETDAEEGTQYGAVDVDANEGLDAGIADGEGVVAFTDLPSGDRTVEVRELGSVFIRNVTEPHSLIDNAEVEVIVSGDQQTVDRQTISPSDNGVIDMTGLDITESYIFVVDAPDYHIRAVVVEDLSQQESIFLLNETFPSTQAAFQVVDLTGQFSEPLVEIDRVINRSIYDSSQPAEYQWTTVGGDRLGADAQLIMDLEQNARYRVVIQNQEGQTRVLGEYTARQNETVPLEVGEITWDVPAEDGFRVQTNQTEHPTSAGDELISFQYQDTADLTDELCITIHERGDESNVLYPEDCYEDLGTVKITQPVTGSELNTSWVVDWEADRDGNTLGSDISVGEIGEIPLPIEDRWLTPIVLIILIGGLSVAPKSGARTGALVIVAMAFGVTMLGFVDIPAPALGVAGAIALIGKAADFNRF